MKKLILCLLVIVISSAASIAQEIPQVAVFTNVSANAQSDVNKIYKSYLEMKNALVESDDATALTASKNLSSLIKKTNSKALKGEQKSFMDKHLGLMKKSLATMNKADIKLLRENFEPLGTSSFALLKAFSANTEEAYLQYCPMALNNKGAFWLSDKKNILNPYYGSMMLKCGSVKETIGKK